MDRFSKFDEQHGSLGIGPMLWCKDSSVKWWRSDTEELFDQNWSDPKKRAKLESLGWTKSSIEYRRNDMGFRMDIDMMQIRPGKCDFYLGCSHTFGIGLNLEDTWCWKLALYRGLTCVNLGYPGGSAETQYRLLRAWAGRLRPRRAYTLGYYLGRREVMIDNIRANQIGPWTDYEPGKTLYTVMTSYEENIISTYRAFDAMRAVCFDYGIELYSPTSQAGKIVYPNKYHKGARDLIHNSPEWHSSIADLAESDWERLA